MDREKIILNIIKSTKRTTCSSIAKKLNISRQAVHKHLRRLLEKDIVIKIGTTKGAYFTLKEYERGKPPHYKKHFKKVYKIKGLEEHTVFEEIETFLNLKSSVNKNVYKILKYAFLEILNNAIEHSLSSECSVIFVIENQFVFFQIRDRGIGLFASLKNKLKLSDEYEALLELTKGKRTTMPSKHTGEGVFFTSRCGDRVSFRSHKLVLLRDNFKKDFFVERKYFIKGTEVSFKINKLSGRKLENIFNSYAPEEFDYKFEKTGIKVKLFREDLLSRSEARRLLAGLENFKEILLDFSNVKGIGQGFADEIFRIFLNNNPQIKIHIKNANEAIIRMIKHSVDKNTIKRLTIS